MQRVQLRRLGQKRLFGAKSQLNPMLRNLNRSSRQLHSTANRLLEQLEPIDPRQTYFDVFTLPKQFKISAPQLKRRFLDLQRKVHPDAYAQAGEEQANRAKLWSETVNRAYKTLVSPLERAEYLVSSL
jgi:molecular chaperone HscB